MNCKRVQYQLMLDQAGEQSAWQHRRLARHLAGCAACRAWRAEWQALALAARAAPVPPLTDAVRGRILAAGRRALAERGVAAGGAAARSSRAAPARWRVLEWPLVTHWRPALAAAAVLLLLAGGVRLATQHPAAHSLAWDDGLDQQLEQMNKTIAGLSTDVLDMRLITPDEPSPAVNERPDTDLEAQVI